MRFVKAFIYGASGMGCVSAASYFQEQYWAANLPAVPLGFCLGFGLLVTAFVHLVQGSLQEINALSGGKPVRHLVQALVFAVSCFFFLTSVFERNLSTVYILSFVLAGLGSGVVASNQLARAFFAWVDARRERKRLSPAS